MMKNEAAHTFIADILVVDDIRENLRLLSKMLVAQGYHVRPVSSGARAISAIQDQYPDLILLDIIMPGMDGYEVCQQLQADESTRDIPIIFISALNETFDKVKAFAVGGRDYISKPFNEKEVMARVKTHLSLHFTQQSLKTEIAERKRVEHTLRQYNQDLALVNRMGQALQACQVEQDTYEVITDTCMQLFPGSSGQLLISRQSDTELESVAHWGDASAALQPIHAADFVYPDTPHAVVYPDAGQTISQFGYSQQAQRFYVPVTSQNKLLAVLSIALEHEEAENLADDLQHSIKSKHLLIIEMTEHYALALVNLRLREMLRIESIHDPLTGLYNRRHMEASLEREIHRAQRHQKPVAILMLDIDHFKIFNDTYGHKAGDAVLKEVGELLNASCRGEDIACRYGGEEFLLILPNATLENTLKRAERLLQTVRQHHVSYQKKNLAVTASMGMAAYPEHGSDIQELVGAADAALYRAKEQGRDQVVLAV
ncbi:diguanylate cyclase [Candidatus Venteria ishoeyi]|uniref:diguanylate cyclase n=1 Tax=Candidatus Venteria ishoeyi TaxID=1899563 RepID=UPI0025A672FB|nr:diguanylate cyclase [Candidatus Venteria ishoeyi]MDM8547679.1 diguanylate cyclase [Candidatus Venteria ishoeyi]